MYANLRDHLANQRTFLAWLRTGLALVAFGLVVGRLSLFLHYLGATVSPHQSVQPQPPGSC
jgi:putative membrane protein